MCHRCCQQEARRKAKAEKLEKIRKGEKASTDKHRTKELKGVSKAFYQQVRVPALLFRVPG